MTTVGRFAILRSLGGETGRDMAQKIFVNYRREDGRWQAARIRDQLADAFGNSAVFMDVDDLRPGQRFDEVLREAIARTDVFLAVIGPHWSELLRIRQASGDQDFVREEIAAALAARIPLIPVLLERATLPRRAELPDDLRAMVLHQKHEIRFERFGRDVRELIDAIGILRKSRSDAAFARAEVLQGSVRVSHEWESAWIDLAKVTTFKKGDRLRIALKNRNAKDILVRFLPLGADQNSKAGLLPHPIPVPPNLLVEIVLEEDAREIVQVSVHGGQMAWDIRLRDGNGGAELESVEMISS
jgi:hypothetical protein